MISEPARRISSCSSPTALFAPSSERKELEQTSSASASVWWASVPRAGPHFMQHHGQARLGRLPGRFGPGQAAADDMKFFRHGGFYYAPAIRSLKNGGPPGKPR